MGGVSLLDEVTRWVFPSTQSPSDNNVDSVGINGIAYNSRGQTPGNNVNLPTGTSDIGGGTHYNSNFNENIVTTSVFIVMVLIFIGVLLIACCKVLIGCTARNFLTANRNNQANMIYAINGQIIGNNGASQQAQQSSSQQNPTLPPPSTVNAGPPAYDELSVYSLPPVYQFELDKDSSDKGESEVEAANEVIVNIALQESLNSPSHQQNSDNSSSDDEIDEDDDNERHRRRSRNVTPTVIPVVEDYTNDDNATSNV